MASPLENVPIKCLYSPKVTPYLMLTSITGSTILQTIYSGALTIALPTIGKQLGFSGQDLQWPLTMFSLANGAFLLIMGALADTLGRRLFFFIGVGWIFVFSLALAFVQNAVAFITVSALLGLGGAILQPPATGLLSSIPDPKLRNYSYSALGAGQPLGYVIGLLLGGFFSHSWRIIAYMLTGGAFVFMVLGLASLPADTASHPHVWNGRQQYGEPPSKLQLLARFDWLGATLSTVGLVLLTFALADAGSSAKGWKTPFVPAFLPLAALCLLSFGIWELKLEQRFIRGTTRIAPLLPHSIWRTPTLKPLLVMIFLLWLAFNSFSFYATLWIQEVQGLGSLDATIRYIPMVVAGILFNIIAGVVMNKVHGLWLIAFGGLGSAASCLIFAVMHKDTSYWAGLFPCFVLTVMTDLVFPPAQLYACDVVGPSRAALAGGLFSTTTRLATSLGLALSATISSSVTARYARKHQGLTVTSPEPLAKGYQAAMWFCFSCCLVGIVVSFGWLRGIGIVGCKEVTGTASESASLKSGTAGRPSLTGSKSGKEAGLTSMQETELPYNAEAGPSSGATPTASGSQTPKQSPSVEHIELQGLPSHLDEHKAKHASV
ncbi:unnamed protein product [Parajaminaea phylloscopi]